MIGLQGHVGLYTRDTSEVTSKMMEEIINCKLFTKTTSLTILNSKIICWNIRYVSIIFASGNPKEFRFISVTFGVAFSLKMRDITFKLAKYIEKKKTILLHILIIHIECDALVCPLLLLSISCLFYQSNVPMLHIGLCEMYDSPASHLLPPLTTGFLQHTRRKKRASTRTGLTRTCLTIFHLQTP